MSTLINASNRKTSLLSIDTCEAHKWVTKVVDLSKKWLCTGFTWIVVSIFELKKKKSIGKLDWLACYYNKIKITDAIIVKYLLYYLHCYLWCMLCFMQMYPFLWYVIFFYWGNCLCLDIVTWFYLTHIWLFNFELSSGWLDSSWTFYWASLLKLNSIQSDLTLAES